MLKLPFKQVSGGQNIPSVCCKRPCPAGQAEKVGCARLPLAPPAFAVGPCFVTKLLFLPAAFIRLATPTRQANMPGYLTSDDSLADNGYTRTRPIP